MDLDKLEQKLRENGALGALASSPEGKALGSRLDENALRAAVRQGDADALQEILRGVLATPEGKALAEKVKKAAGKP